MGSCFQSAGLFSFFIWVTIPQLGAFRHSDDCTLRSFKKNEILRGFKLQLQAHQLPLEVFEFIASVRLSSLSNPIFVTSKFTLLVLSPTNASRVTKSSWVGYTKLESSSSSSSNVSTSSSALSLSRP